MRTYNTSVSQKVVFPQMNIVLLPQMKLHLKSYRALQLPLMGTPLSFSNLRAPGVPEGFLVGPTPEEEDLRGTTLLMSRSASKAF